jgi:hypothetical protein
MELRGCALGGEILDLRLGPGAGAAQGLGAVEAGPGLVAKRRGAADLRDGGLDVGPALLGVEHHRARLRPSPGAFLELDALDDARDPAVTVMDSKARTVPTASRVSTMRLS